MNTTKHAANQARPDNRQNRERGRQRVQIFTEGRIGDPLSRLRQLLAVVTVALIAGLTAANAAGLEKRHVAVTAAPDTEDADQASEKPAAKQEKIIIDSIDEEGGKGGSAQVTWLGVSADEASEALAAQLALNHGEGLVISYVTPDSPAAKAGLEKNDVLAQIDDQLLVHPAQLRKLVRMHKAGDTIELTFYRNGKKQTVSATLAKTSAHANLMLEEHSLPGDLGGLKLKLRDDLRGQMKALHDSLARAGIDKEKLHADIQRSLEEARTAMRDAMRHVPDYKRELDRASRQLEELARSGVEVGNDATVTVRNHGKSVKTMVKTDDAGIYVIVAGPKKRLTAHDKDGKLLFDGEIDTAEQQEKVPKDVWEKVKPMLEKLGPRKTEHPAAEEDSDRKPGE